MLSKIIRSESKATQKKLVAAVRLLGINILDKILLLHCLISYYTSSQADEISCMDLYV